MGKLHSLRREIEREPERWFSIAPMQSTVFGKIPCGARKVDGHWHPIVRSTSGMNRFSYAMYVHKVLSNIGIRTDKPRAVAGVWRSYNWQRKQK